MASRPFHKTERDRYISLAFCWADLLFELDRDLLIVFAAGATQAFFGRSEDSLPGSSFRDLVLPADLPLVAQFLKQVARHGRADGEVVRLKGPSGGQIWVSLAAYCLDPEQGTLYLGVRRSRPAEKATALAVPRMDGLYDSGTFAELAAERLKKIQSAGETAQVTMLSIPAMKTLEDRLGSGRASQFAQSLRDFLKAHSVGGDSAAKVGDGRFSILHATTTPIGEMASQVAALTQRVDPSGRGADVELATLTMDRPDISEEDLAKGLLYALNRFRTGDGKAANLQELSANMSTLVEEAAAEVNDFRELVTHRRFRVALQPILAISDGAIHHFEALCRFDKAPGASPFEIISFAEETGLIHEFDLAMAKQVIDWLGRFPRSSTVRVAVNVSGFSIGQPIYVDSLSWLLKDNEWTRGRLMFVITESSRMSDLDAANRFIETLRRQGHEVCLDDFGAGAASFQYLSVLDVDTVKIDGSAIKNAQKARKGRAFLSALTDLCRRMQVNTIAEMVDTPERLQFCRDCGCDYIQGFLFGKPSPDIRDFEGVGRSDLFRRPPAPR